MNEDEQIQRIDESYDPSMEALTNVGDRQQPEEIQELIIPTWRLVTLIIR